MLYSLYRHIHEMLTPRYGAREAQAVALLLIEHLVGAGRTDVFADAPATPPQEEALLAAAKRISEGEPVQYVTGSAVFMGEHYEVTPSVLIPRPETAWLVERCVALFGKEEKAAQRKDDFSQSEFDFPQNKKSAAKTLRFLDVGTGSGCVACALARAFPDAEVEAFDVSADALDVARANAVRAHVDVTFTRVDMRAPVPYYTAHPERLEAFDALVSNPPYVRESERATMAEHVVGHEPSLALFVPDTDAFWPYRALARMAQRLLRTHGVLLVEANEALVEQTAAVLVEEGLEQVEIFADCFARPRFLQARKP